MFDLDLHAMIANSYDCIEHAIPVFINDGDMSLNDNELYEFNTHFIIITPFDEVIDRMYEKFIFRLYDVRYDESNKLINLMKTAGFEEIGNVEDNEEPPYEIPDVVD